MAWNEAFLKQARSDHAILERLNHPRVEYCHRLHYVQMVTEKLSKARLSSSRRPAPPTHSAFVRMLQNLKGRPEIRRQLNFSDTTSFNKYINSLLGLAAKIEKLAPALSGNNQPNPEYPWSELPSGKVNVPAEYDFSEFAPTDPKMQKLMALVRVLLDIGV